MSALPERPTHLISVLTPDRTGIVHALMRTLDAAGAQASQISQTVVAGAFTIALVVHVPDEVDARTLSDSLASAAGPAASASLLVLSDEPSLAHASPDRTDRYLLTALASSDDAQAVAELSRTVADRGGNFVDFTCDRSQDQLRLVAELELAADGTLGDLQDALAEVAASVVGRTVRLQHERLFAATNDVAFRRLGR